MNETPARVDAILFDFDGVILETVLPKQRAFRELMSSHAPEHLDAIMQYYWTHGGISRLVKFQWIWANILHNPLTEETLAELNGEFSNQVYPLVLEAPFVAGADVFLAAYHAQWPCYVISGTPQAELRSLIQDRALAHFFRGVYGSPETKVEIGTQIIEEHGYDRRHVWFVGDATTDRDAARALNVRFVGIDGPHLSPFLDGNEITIRDLSELADVLTGT